MAGPNVHKSTVRDQVWQSLRQVALPDSRFGFDFSSFIADFRGSSDATALLIAHPLFISSQDIFITPDNCLEELRFISLEAGKRILITTYGIRRGFYVLDPRHIKKEKWELACTLDGMEKLGKPISMAELREQRQSWNIGMMVTGTGAINQEGVRFGKGHGYFDLEWALLSTLKIVSKSTITVGLVHDCQMLDQQLTPEVFDTVCDLIVTNTRILEVSGAKKPSCGIVWDMLQDGMLEDIPPLRELREMKI